MDEVIRDLEQMRRYAVALDGVLADARAKVPPRAQGEDKAKAVRVVLDATGLPAEVQVASDWPRRLPPARLGPAVTDAFNQASQARVAEWGKALDGRWSREIDDLKQAADSGRPPAAADPPPVQAPPPAPGRARPIEAIFEDAIRAVDNSLAYAERAATVTEYAGENRDRTVKVSLSRAGLVSCSVHAGWATGKSGQVLTAAVRDALASARARLANADREPSPVGEVDALFGEVMGLLDGRSSDD